MDKANNLTPSDRFCRRVGPQDLNGLGRLETNVMTTVLQLACMIDLSKPTMNLKTTT